MYQILELLSQELVSVLLNVHIESPSSLQHVPRPTLDLQVQQVSPSLTEYK